MSVIVRQPNGKIRLMVKGAVSVQRINSDNVAKFLV